MCPVRINLTPTQEPTFTVGPTFLCTNDMRPRLAFRMLWNKEQELQTYLPLCTLQIRIETPYRSQLEGIFVHIDRTDMLRSPADHP